ncbi:Cytoplasmic protein [Azospirillaceae bacterium]
MTNLTDRLNKVLDRMMSDDLLGGRGLGNEIGFHIFDYDPADELAVRSHIGFLMAQIPKLRPTLRVKHLNLFSLVTSHLDERRLLDKALEQGRKKGDAFLRKALAEPLHGKKLAPIFEKASDPKNHDLVLVSGIGSVYPLLRTHSLLNNLHHVMEHTPLILFFPGRYDGQSLRLFGLLHDDNYYRAFRLVP